MKLSQKIQETNPIKYANPRNTKESGCQNRKKIYAYHHSLPGRWQTSIDQKNHAGTHDCAHCKIHNPLQHPFFHGLLSFAISFDYCIIFLKPCRYVWYFPESFFQNSAVSYPGSSSMADAHTQITCLQLYSSIVTIRSVRWYAWYRTPAASNIRMDACTEVVPSYLLLS